MPCPLDSWWLAGVNATEDMFVMQETRACVTAAMMSVSNTTNTEGRERLL
jgi:hypothetical protein